MKNQDSNSQVLPETGESNQSDILSIIGASGLLILGISLLIFRKRQYKIDKITTVFM